MSLHGRIIVAKEVIKKIIWYDYKNKIRKKKFPWSFQEMDFHNNPGLVSGRRRQHKITQVGEHRCTSQKLMQ